MRKIYKTLLSFLFFILTNWILYSQSQQEKENIIVQMNYCINSLTNIVNNQSMTVLNYEADQILNNLKLTEIRGELELQNFRTELFDAIRNLQITEQEKAIMNRVRDLKSKNLMWKSLSSALNPTMLLAGPGKIGPQIVFQAIVTAARTAVDYQATKGENEIDEIQAMWDLKKKELEKIGELRSNALKITFSLYDKYHFLNEWDRLTEETAKKFSNIINEPKASKRVRLLKENENIFKMLPDYYYHLGMALLGDDPEGKDANYEAAKIYLDKYLIKYQRTPIFRYDQKSGIIALTKLAYEQNLSASKKKELIKTALSNLPNNGSALIQCALIYILELNQPGKGYELLRIGLDNNYSNINAILSTITFYIDDIKKYPSIHKEIVAAVDDCSTIALNEFIAFALANNSNPWTSLSKIFSVEKGPSLKILSDRYFDCSGIHVYKVDYSSTEGEIEQQDLIPQNSFSNRTLLKKVDAFAVKGNENLMYAFVEPVILGERYSVKKNLDFNKLRRGEFQGSNVFTLTESDIEDIVKFCEKNERKGSGMKITLEDSKAKVKQGDITYSLLDQYYQTSETILQFSSEKALQKSEFMMEIDYNGKDSISFIPAKFKSITGNFLVIDFGDITHTIVTYKEDGSDWIPFSIERSGSVTYYSAQNVTNPNKSGVIVSTWKKLMTEIDEIIHNDQDENTTGAIICVGALPLVMVAVPNDTTDNDTTDNSFFDNITKIFKKSDENENIKKETPIAPKEKNE